MFSKANKFDSINWSSWQRLIQTAVLAKEAFGYLDRSIIQPSLLPTILSVAKEKPTPITKTL